jgi:amino acid permease
MKKLMKVMWLIVIGIFALLVVLIPFGVNSSLLAHFLGEYIIAPLLLIQIIVWIFVREKIEVENIEPLNNQDGESNSSSSLPKAVYSHMKDVASEIKPAVDNYVQKHQTSKSLYCIHCGNKCENDALFCVMCGKTIEELK